MENRHSYEIPHGQDAFLPIAHSSSAFSRARCIILAPNKFLRSLSWCWYCKTWEGASFCSPPPFCSTSLRSRRNGDCLARRKTVFENVACDSSTAQLTHSFILLKSFPSGYMLAVSINACPINANGIPKISSWCQQHSSNPHGSYIQPSSWTRSE